MTPRHRLVAVLAVLLAVVLPVAAFADAPVPGDASTITATTPPVIQVTPDGDLIVKSVLPAVTIATSARHAEAKFRAYAAEKRLKARIVRLRRSAESWARVMGRSVRQVHPRHLTAQARYWKRTANTMRRLAQRPPHLAEFLCIHRYEGSWTDSGGPYYGGLQMDLGFQRTYAPQLLRTKGTADHWTPLEQIWTAEKAARSRGFWPWPNTARSCGLL